MLRVLTAREMREVDRATIEEHGIPGLILMEGAAAAVTRLLSMFCEDLDAEKILVLCGKGNNGGDGLAVGRQLLQLNPEFDLQVILLAEPETLSGDAAVNWRMLKAQDHVPLVASNPDAWRNLLPGIADSTIVVDAVLGTGLDGPARCLASQVIADLNTGFRNSSIIAVDMPSGLGSDSGEPAGDCMRTDCTVTFTAPKVGQVLPPSCDQVGELVVARIGTPDSVLATLPGPRLLLSEAVDAARFSLPRDRSGHKGSYGHVLAIGGSRSKPGAILMTGVAALRAGAGLVTVATAAGAAETVIAAAPELMLEPGLELEDGSLGPDAFGPGLCDAKSVVALGPGLGDAPANRALGRKLYEECPLPLVVDADGLAAVEVSASPPRRAPTVLTPHPGEMARLAGMSTAEVQRDRLRTVRAVAERTGAWVVLKGHRTLVAAPDGDTTVNPTGSPGMGTAGSGDILTGIIAALLAQFPDRPVLETVAAAVYLHGLAGELAAEDRGEQGMLATDISRFLEQARRAVTA